MTDSGKVSIGIPTYNRPVGLKRTLDKIINQTYQNLEIIISDNCSPSDETEILVKDLMKSDSRINYIRQEFNKGLIYNFQFVLNKATSNYFMWATDDDYFESNDLIEKLVVHAKDNILTFTNYNFVSDESIIYNFFTPIFNSCKSRFDYIYSFCKNGAGHPSCGMYNLALLKEEGINLKIQDDLNYHMEGMLLHTIFNTGKVKYIDDAIINFNTYSRESASIIPRKRVLDFLVYTKRVLWFYVFHAKHLFREKCKLLKCTIVLHYNYFINDLNGRKFVIHRFSVIVFLLRVIFIRKSTKSA